MVKTGVGQKPKVLLNNAASFLVSKSYSVDNGVTNGRVCILSSTFECIISMKNTSICHIKLQQFGKKR